MSKEGDNQVVLAKTMYQTLLDEESKKLLASLVTKMSHANSGSEPIDKKLLKLNHILSVNGYSNTIELSDNIDIDHLLSAPNAFLQAKAKDNVIGKLIRQEILNFQKYMIKGEATAENRTKTREELGKIVAEISAEVSGFIKNSAQQDAAEFLTPIFTHLFGNNPTTLTSTVRAIKNGNVDIEDPDPKIEPLPLPNIEMLSKNQPVYFSEMIENFEKPEIIDGSNGFKFDLKGGGTTSALDFNKETSINFNKKDEIAFHLKRFGNDLAKNNSPVNFNTIKRDDKSYDLTAFIVHYGSVSSGHYIAYIKEFGEEWYCYNDGQRSKVSSEDLEDAKKQAYVVKYATTKANLPPHQTAGTNGGANRCWMNASLAFLGSFTTIDKENLLTKKQNDDLRNEILRGTEKKKEEPVVIKIQEAQIFKSTFNNQNQESALEGIVQQTVVDPDLRAAFLDYLDVGNNLFDGIDNNTHILHKKELEWNNSDSDLKNKFTKEFAKQYLIFLFQKYSGCGVTFDAEIIDGILDDLNKDGSTTTNKQYIEAFKVAEESIIVYAIINYLGDETNKNSPNFQKQQQAFRQIISDKTVSPKVQVEHKNNEQSQTNQINENLNQSPNLNQNNQINNQQNIQEQIDETMLITKQWIESEDTNTYTDNGIIGTLKQNLEKQKDNPKPNGAYVGIGVGAQVINLDGQQALEITDIFSPDKPRFFTDNDCQLSMINPSSMQGKIITSFTVGDKTYQIDELLNQAGGLETIAGHFHDGSKNITFTIQDQNGGNKQDITCQRKENLCFVTSDCEAVKGNLGENKGAWYDPKTHGLEPLLGNDKSTWPGYIPSGVKNPVIKQLSNENKNQIK